MNAFLANLYLRAITVRDREEGQAMAEYGVILALDRSARDRVPRRVPAGAIGGAFSDIIGRHLVVGNLSGGGGLSLVERSPPPITSKRFIRSRILSRKRIRDSRMNTKTRYSENEQGQAMVEFAIVLPILLMLVFGIIQFGILFNQYSDPHRRGAGRRDGRQPSAGRSRRTRQQQRQRRRHECARPPPAR